MFFRTVSYGWSRGAAAWLIVALSLAAQAPPGARKAGAGKKRAGAGRAMPQPITDETGFQPIFDGRSLNGWDGDPKLWRVENGTIVGQTTPDTMPKQNSFLIWRGGQPADFELKLEYRLGSTNSGIQYRSAELPDIRWAMRGYQADIDAEERYTGQIYEERGRGFLALRGQFNYIGDGQQPGILGALGDAEEMKSSIKHGDWNQFHIIARGNLLVQILNGRVMSALIDDDTANRKMDGLIGFQLHLGPPMKMELRNIRIKMR